MDNLNILGNIGDLAKPVNTLIEKVSDAVEGLAKPIQIKRVAQAQAEANKILAATDIEITELRQRAMTRLVLEEARRQENMESILMKSLPEVTEEAHPQDIDRDWITHFFEKGRLISNEDMQELWAALLAGQANSPSSFSKRTIDVLSTLEQSDAILFSKLAGFSIITMSENIYPLIYDPDDALYTRHGISFSIIAHLESLGLLHFNMLGPYELGNITQMFSVFYFDSQLQLEFPEPLNRFIAGRIMLTQAGNELVRICDAEPIDGFIEYLLEQWQQLGYKPRRIADDSTANEVADTDS